MASASQAQTAPQQASASTTAAAAPAVDAELSLAAAAAPVPAQGAPEAPARQPKAAKLQGDVKAEAAPAADHTETPAPNSAPRLAPKSAAPQSAPKEAIAVAPSDARESAPPSQPATSAPAPAASTHTQHAAAEQIAARAAPAAQVAREIVRRFDGGNTRFELRLDPPELGRVEVRLDVSRDHRVTAVIAADSPQALTELARHARDLEQMLQSAGLELSDSGLSFDLRQGGERAETAEFSAGSSDGAPLMEEATQVAARPLGYERWRGVRVDMMV
jgi:flagellar hook-length control protein FliK